MNNGKILKVHTFSPKIEIFVCYKVEHMLEIHIFKKYKFGLNRLYAEHFPNLWR